MAIGISYSYWYTEYCYTEHPFICRVPLTKFDGKCPQNSTLSVDGNSCWFGQNKTLNFVDAEMTWALYGGHLASSHSPYDDNQLSPLVLHR